MINQNVTSIREAQSRYQKGGVSDVYKKRIGWWERTIFEKDASDRVYVIESKYDRRPDLLAHDVYKKENIGWFILQYNNIIDINTEFVSGKTILLPIDSRVKFYLL